MGALSESGGRRSGGDTAQLERAVAGFEAAWHAGARPAIEDYLPAHALAAPGVLLELVHTELELRLKAGEAARVEDYLARFPQLADRPAAVPDLLAAEYRLRRRAEPDLGPDDLLRRFPH